MDSFTLMVAIMLAGLIMAAAMAMLYRASSREPCLLDWSIAGTLFAVYCMIGLVALTGKLPHLIAPGFTNACYIAGHYVIAAGLRRHFGMRPRYDIVLSIAGVSWLLHLIPQVQSSVLTRLVLFTPVIICANLYVLWLCHTVRDIKARSSFLPLAILVWLFMGQMLLRVGLMAISPDGMALTFYGSQLMQTSGSLALLVFLSVAPMACALIVIRKQELALRRATLTDSMTGWMNRRALHDIASREFERSQSTCAPLSFLIFDIDHFKRINDQYGHAVGDLAICHVTALAAQALRGHDEQFRIGGEEFTILFNGHGIDQARNAGERMRRLIESTPLTNGERHIPITVSMGVAARQECDTSWESILGRADIALYHAKQTGRNRLCVNGGQEQA